MASKRSNNVIKVRLPGAILNEIYDNDNENDDLSRPRKKQKTFPKKSRKDARREERISKKKKQVNSLKSHKQKVQPTINDKSVNNNNRKKSEMVNDKGVLKPLKRKNSIKPMKSVRFQGAENDSSSSENDTTDNNNDSDVFDTEDDEIDNITDDENESVDSTMAKLKALKAKKLNKTQVKIDSSTEDEQFEGDEIDTDEEEEESVDSTMAKLKALKAKKLNKNKTKTDPSNDDEQSEDDEITDDEEGESVDSTMAKLKALKALKARKLNKTESSKTKDKKTKKASKVSEKSKKTDNQKSKIKRTPEFQKDDEDILFYSKKLGTKSIKKTSEDDWVGGLLDGLDFLNDDKDTNEEEEEEEQEEENDFEGSGSEEEETEKADLPFSSDDELNSSDFDSDSLGLDEEDSDGDEEPVKKEKENPYIAPVPKTTTSKYIPPALRRKMLEETVKESEEMIKLRRIVKGYFNRLSEANIDSILTELNNLYMNNPNHSVTSVITDVILDSTAIQGALLERFVIVHGAAVAALYRTVGISFGAHFIQTLVERFNVEYKSELEEKQGKSASNLLTLLCVIYTFQTVSCTLVYDIIRLLLEGEIHEVKTELLLKLIKNAGHGLRSDDPGALKGIILLQQKSMANADPSTISLRSKFLAESISSLKNNRLKSSGLASNTDSIIRMKNYLGGISGKHVDPIRVSLDDINNIETKGKWWLVGAAWKNNTSNGNIVNAQSNNNDAAQDVDMIVLNDIVDNAEVNLMDLAREQRMNTDIRRAIFVTIMGAEDAPDAFTKLNKLNLKRVQEREIVKVLLHCCSSEKTGYNPYYGFLAVKLCEQRSLRKTFNFSLWNFFDELEGNIDDDEESFSTSNNSELNLQKSINLAGLYGKIISENILNFNSFKNINLLTASTNLVIFLELLFIDIFNRIALNSKEKSIGGGHKYNDKKIVELMSKSKGNDKLLSIIGYFLINRVLTSEGFKNEKQKKRVEWGVDAFNDLVEVIGGQSEI